MIVVTALYPATEGSTFNEDYYVNTHMPMVKGLLEPLGLRDFRFMRGVADAGGGPLAFRNIGELTFDTMEAVGAALGAHAPQIMGDIPNFTDAPPVMQFNEVL